MRMRFFPVNFSLKVIKKISDYLDEDAQRNMRQVNKAWHTYPFNPLPLEVIASQDIPVDHLLPHLVNILPTAVSSIKINRLNDGCSPWAASYKVEIGQECFVVRCINHDKGKASEVLASLYFSECGVSPKVEYFDYQSGIFIMHFVSNDPALLRGLKEEQLEDIALKLQTIHQAPKLKRRADVEPSTLISKRRQQLNEMLKHYPEFYMLAYALEQLDYLGHLTKQDSYCHNDINPNNLLAEKDNIFFIDWECAGVNDTLLDVATIAATLRLNQKQSDYLLRQYIGKEPSEEQYTHYNRMMQLALFRFAISFAANIKNPQSVLSMNIKRIPLFNHYHPDKHGVIDKSSDIGRYFISVMLIKQAMSVVNDYQFKAQIAFEQQQPFCLHHIPIPRVIWHRIIDLLNPYELSRLRLINRAWKDMVDAQINPAKRLIKQNVLDLAKSVELGERLWSSLAHFNPKMVGELRPLTGGLSPFCQNFVLAVGAHKFVIKVMADNAVGFIQESMVNALASQRGIGPTVEWIDVNNKVQVIEFVDNDFTWLRNRASSQFAELAAALKSLHNIPQSNLGRFFGNDKFEVMVQTVQKQISKWRHLNEFNYAVVLLRQLEPLLAKDIKQALCHFDVNPWNVLYRSGAHQFKLIDWEFSRVGHPLIDVATIANFLRLSLIEEAFLLMAYFNEGISERDEACYQLVKLYCYLRYAICSLAINGEETYSIDEAIVKQLPSFNQFNPRELKIDKDTAEGRYYIAKMFLNSALKLVKEVDFVKDIKLFRNCGTKEMEMLRVPLLEGSNVDEQRSMSPSVI